MNLSNGLSLPRLIDKLNQIFNAPPSAPEPIPAYRTPADLPPATGFLPSATTAPMPGAPSGSSGLVLVMSIPALAYSNGVNWLRADTGASIA